MAAEYPPAAPIALAHQTWPAIRVPHADLAPEQGSHACLEGQTLYLGSDQQSLQLELDTGEARSFSCSAVGVDALVTTLDRIVWGGSDSDGLLNGLQIGPAEHEGIFVVPK